MSTITIYKNGILILSYRPTSTQHRSCAPVEVCDATNSANTRSAFACNIPSCGTRLHFGRGGIVSFGAGLAYEPHNRQITCYQRHPGRRPHQGSTPGYTSGAAASSRSRQSSNLLGGRKWHCYLPPNDCGFWKCVLR